MGLWTNLLDGLVSGAFAGGLAVLLTAPPRDLLPAFLCGAAGRLLRDEFVSWGVSVSWSTMIAAAGVVLLATALMRRRAVSPAVLISAVLPLGAATAIFNMLLSLMKIPALSGEELNKAAVALAANTSKAFIITLAVALGMCLGLMIVRFFERDHIVEV